MLGQKGSLELELYTEKYGIGDKYLFIPGITGTVNYWKPYLQPYTTKGKFILVDPLGFGRSPKPNIKYTIDNHIRSLHHTVMSEGPFTIVGHSMGSLLALNFANNYPDLVKKVVLIGMPVFKSEKAALTYFFRRLQIMLTFQPLAAATCIFSRIIVKNLSPFLQNRERISHLWSPAMVDDMLMHTSKSFTSSLWEVVYRSHIVNVASTVSKDIPIICLHGKKDYSAPFSHIKQIAEKYENWKLHTIDGGTHQIFIEHPEWCIDYILNGKEKGH